MGRITLKMLEKYEGNFCTFIGIIQRYSGKKENIQEYVLELHKILVTSVVKYDTGTWVWGDRQRKTFRWIYTVRQRVLNTEIHEKHMVDNTACRRHYCTKQYNLEEVPDHVERLHERGRRRQNENKQKKSNRNTKETLDDKCKRTTGVRCPNL